MPRAATVVFSTLITAAASIIGIYKGSDLWRGINKYKTAESISTGSDLWKGSNECKTAECIATAKRIASYMDPEVDPCDDFYKFACGNFLKTAKIQDDMTRKDIFTDLTDTLHDQLKQLVYEKPRPDEARPFYYLKHFFQLCLDEDAIDNRGTGHVVELLEKAGGWSLLGTWQRKNWDWFTTKLQLSQINMDDGSMFAMNIKEDISRNDRRVIWIDQGELPLPREYLIKGAADPVVQAHFKYMVEVVVAMGAKREDWLQRSLSKVLDFQIKLANIHTAQDQRRDFSRTYKLKSLNEMLKDNRLNWINWRTYFEIMPKGVTLKEDELIIITDLEFFKRLKNLMFNSPKEVVANHMMFMAVHKKVPLLTKQLRKLQLDLKKRVFGIKTDVPRWEVCIEMAPSLDLALSSLYVEKLFDHSRKEAASDMMNRVRKELLKDFKELDWMDADTREKAESKASLTYELVGYPDEIANITKLEEHYSELKLNTEHLFEAQLDLTGWATQYSFKRLREPVDKKDWRQFSSMAIVNAYYNPVNNAIVFPAGILQPPFFGSQLPSYVNYASIGFLMGHMLTHGFDEQGSKYNAKGDLEVWWDESTMKKFKGKTEHVVDQYATFKEPQTQLKLNGINTLGENIADIGGLKMVFRAYRHQASQLKKPEPMLPGLNKYSREQLFMITLANVWCSVTRPERMKKGVLTDEHAPSQFRVNGALMNLEEFGDLFKCAPGTPMNPHDKCNVW